MTNQSSDSEIFCPEERIKELELRTQQRNNIEEGLFKDRFPTEEELVYHKKLLGEPQPPFSTLEPKIRKGNPWSLKIPCVIGTIYTCHAYIDLQSPINIMSCAYYNKIREKPFQARRNPYQPYKFCNFIGRAKNMHIFIGCFIYVMNFMILEDLGSIINSGLNEVVLGQPFARTSKLTYDKSLGLIRYFSFGRHLEDLHVTWAHLEKKRTRLRTNTKTLEDLCSQSLETASQAIHDAVTTHKVTASQHFETASARTDSYADLEDSTYDGVTTKTRRRRVAKASKERLDVVKSLMACKPKPGASICAFILEMKGKETSIMEIHSLLQTAEPGIKKIDVPSTLAAPMLTVGHNAKKRKTSHSKWNGKATKGKSDRGSKRKVESEIAPTSDLKEAVCFYCNIKGHWKHSCPKYLKDLKDGKVEKGSHSSMFMIELHNTTTLDSWVLYTGCVICCHVGSII
ncbi:protein kinase-like domain, concanavalin A-like lectin/glucanase domain protein [Tanacetum coccineum]